MPFKTIFFDAAGTLMRPVRPIGQSYALLAASLGMNVPPAEIAARFHAGFAAAPPLAFPGAASGEIQALEYAWWKKLVWQVFEPYGPFSRFDEYFAELFAYFGRADSWTLFPETLDTLSALNKKQLTLAVISNFDSRLFAILQGLGVSSSFDSIVISSRAGHAKPDVRIFHHALALQRVDARDALHIGDSPDKDAAAAKNAGLTGVLLDRKARTPLNSYLKVQNLAGLLPLIDAG
ncbi:MAG: HAD-IA family hydrolase [Candidatus Binatia bacterium]